MLTLLAAVGSVGAALPFLFSLSPSARSDAELPRVQTAAIEPGAFAYVKDPASRAGWESEILLVRSRDGVLRAWFVPIKDGTHRLPDGPWWKPGLPCNELEPDFERGVIYCADPDQPEWATQRYRWTLHGKSLSDQTFDMVPIKGVEESGYFVMHKRGAA